MLSRGVARASRCWLCRELEFKLASSSIARPSPRHALTAQARNMGRCCGGAGPPPAEASTPPEQASTEHAPNPAPPAPQYKATHYKRVLPSPPAIDFSGDEGAPPPGPATYVPAAPHSLACRAKHAARCARASA